MARVSAVAALLAGAFAVACLRFRSPAPAYLSPYVSGSYSHASWQRRRDQRLDSARRLLADGFAAATHLLDGLLRRDWSAPEVVRAAYDYDAQYNDELSFRAGDEIQILARYSDGWWRGRPVAGGATGLLPGNHMAVPVISREETPIAQSGAVRERVSDAEWAARVELAAAYRIVARHGWSHSIYNHITLRLPPEGNRPESFLLHPFGLLYSEVTASSLVKVDVDGDVLDPGSTSFGISRAGFSLHAAIHAARDDARCIFHVHTAAGAAVAALPRSVGLLPLSQEAMLVGEVAYHNYAGILMGVEERAAVARDLGPTARAMILRHHGLVATGRTAAEAFHYLFNLVRACESQTLALGMAGALEGGIAQLRADAPSETVARGVHDTAARGGGGVSTTEVTPGVGALEWSALLRELQREAPGFAD
jgi:ribulose-5-phosphate 4-epimerase/fuculose-1-phosphate aldolase